MTVVHPCAGEHVCDQVRADDKAIRALTESGAMTDDSKDAVARAFTSMTIGRCYSCGRPLWSEES